jgi:hypothetical protein
VCVVTWSQLLQAKSTQSVIPEKATSLPVVVALEISGFAKGGTWQGEQFCDSLFRKLTFAADVTFEVFIWLQNDEAEQLYKHALLNSIGGSRVRLCHTRGEVLAALPTPVADIFDDETESIARQHAPESYGVAWVPKGTPSWLRMLFKLRGVEWMRTHSLASRQDAVPHTWVLRVRPDLTLEHPFEVPTSVTDVWVPWRSEAESLLDDQLLLMPAGSAAPALLAGMCPRLIHTRCTHSPLHPCTLLTVACGITCGTGMYESDWLHAAAAASTPPTLYPERIMWQAMYGGEAPPGTQLMGAAFDARLLGCEGEVPRDAFGKLKSDFPHAFEESRRSILAGTKWERTSQSDLHSAWRQSEAIGKISLLLRAMRTTGGAKRTADGATVDPIAEQGA